LGKLISSNGLKVDIILSDLVNLTISNESIAIKLSLFGGINNVLYKSGDKTSQATFEKLKALTISHLSSEEETIRLAAAKTVSFVALYGSEALISDMILDIFALSKLGPDESIPASSGKLLGLAAVVASSGKKCDEFREEAFEFFLGAAKENFLLLPLSKYNLFFLFVYLIIITYLLFVYLFVH
jgi:CRISPR/Cas system CMR-associated protein Cmr5 small subunit